MILLVRDQLLGAKGALLVDLLLVESSPPRCFALLVGSRLLDVPLRDTHGRDRRVANGEDITQTVFYSEHFADYKKAGKIASACSTDKTS
jgi:hypothetical protein